MMIRKYIALMCVILAISSCTKKEIDEDEAPKPILEEKQEPEPDSIELPLDYKNLTGRWELAYGDNFGYEFRFFHNYKAVVIIRTGGQALVFKGVYQIEDANKIKINIVDMKQDMNTQMINVNTGFSKTKTSYFLIRSSIREKKSVKTIYLRPERVIIDGKDSDGYFEPVMKLRRV